MGGRGSSSGKAGGGGGAKMSIKEMLEKGMTKDEIIAERKRQGLFKEPKVNKIEGVKGSVATSWKDVDDSSLNHLYNTGAILLKNEKGSVLVNGNKKDRFGNLELVNTAVVHLNGIDPQNYTKREVTRINKQLQAIRSMGFDTPKISVDFNEIVVYAKRKLFTKNF